MYCLRVNDKSPYKFSIDSIFKESFSLLLVELVDMESYVNFLGIRDQDYSLSLKFPIVLDFRVRKPVLVDPHCLEQGPGMCGICDVTFRESVVWSQPLVE